MPAVHLAEGAGDQRCGDDGAVDEQKVDLERIGAPQIARRVERPDLAGDVALEAADPSQKAQECNQKRPAAINSAPIVIVRVLPSQRSAMMPPAIGVR